MSVFLTTPLAENADIFNGKTPARVDQRDSGYPVLKIRDVDEGGAFRGTFGSFVDDAFAKKFSGKILQNGDTLVLNAAHNADYVGSKTFFVCGESVGSLATGEWLIIRPNNRQLDAKYANHWLRCDLARRAIRELVKGIHLYPKDVARLEIPLPPLDEQKRIAAILDQADELRRLRQRAIDRLNELGQAIFYEMFDDQAAARADYQPLGQFLDFVTSGGRSWAKFYARNGNRFIRSLDVQMNQIGNQNAVSVIPPDNAEARRTRVEPGDVLLTITGSRIGRVAPVPEEFEPAYISQHVAILRLNKSALLPVFISFFLSLPTGGQHQIEKAQYGQTKPGLNFDQIKAFLVPVPPLDQQKEFCRRIKKTNRLMDRLAGSLSIVDSLFSSLQHRAFRGEL